MRSNALSVMSARSNDSAAGCGVREDFGCRMSDFGCFEPAAKTCDVHGVTRNPTSEIRNPLINVCNNLRMRLLSLAPGLIALAISASADDALARRDDVKKALAYIEASHEKTLASQVTIAEIAAPTFHEGERAKYMAAEFRRVGLAQVEIDKQGNVLGWPEGRVKDTLVLAAQPDIAFAPGVNTKVRKEGPRWHGPGLSDDSRGLAALLAIVEAMNHAGIKTQQTILFLANVGEEIGRTHS